MSEARVASRRLLGFNDTCLGSDRWQALLGSGSSDVVFLTWQWQSAWWETFRRGELLLICAERDGEIVAAAPLFTDAGMVYLVGSGGSDYLDFVGDVNDPEVLDSLLTEARRHVRDFIGFVFYHVPDASPTSRLLKQSAERLGLAIFEESGLPAPVLDANTHPGALHAAIAKKSLVRHERYFVREGGLDVEHETHATEILPLLDEFFTQHQARWAGTDSPSLFLDDQQRQFYRALTTSASDEGWLRFTRILWKGEAIAFHFGFCYRGTFMWYKPSFDIGVARRSPGEVLLRQLLVAASNEPVTAFDFGLGDETFKSRFATEVHHVTSWGLYDPAALSPERRATA